MDYKELIRFARKANGEWEGSHEYYQAAVLIASLCDAIETLLVERGAAGWIKVQERMPEDGTRVLVYHNDGVVRLGIPEKGMFYSVLNKDLERADVTHWMPLPTPPDREQKEEET